LQEFNYSSLKVWFFICRETDMGDTEMFSCGFHISEEISRPVEFVI
jgi:hypothetical protein